MTTQNVDNQKTLTTLQKLNNETYKKTKKSCYRKDIRAMRPIAYMGALKIFEIPCMATPTATANFPDIFMDFCSDRYRDCAYKI